MLRRNIKYKLAYFVILKEGYTRIIVSKSRQDIHKYLDYVNPIIYIKLNINIKSIIRKMGTDSTIIKNCMVSSVLSYKLDNYVMENIIENNKYNIKILLSKYMYLDVYNLIKKGSLNANLLKLSSKNWSNAKSRR